MNVNNCCSHSIRNRDTIKKSVKCGCYFCIRVFDSDIITEYCDRDQTALCPNCGVDALLPDITDKKFLVECNERWFTVELKTILKNKGKIGCL